MARNDPQRLEALRAKYSQDIIDSAPDEQQRKRLAGLQFQIDMERERARTPLQATIRISEMMCHSLAELHKSMVTPLVDDRAEDKSAAPASAAPAADNVLAFRPRVVESEDT